MSPINAGMMSSGSVEWATPQVLYDRLDAEFGFTLDPCATRENAKCLRFFTKEDDGLRQDWAPERVFCNPPYGRVIANWVRKGYEESLRGATVVMLIPARTCSAYWHDYVLKGEIRFIKGRITFGERKRNDRMGIHAAPFPSAIVIFRAKFSTFLFADKKELAGEGNRE